MISCVVFLTAG